MAPFRINAKAIFLTYPQCTTTPQQLGNHLATTGTTTYIIVTKELHEDGHPHLHALVLYVDKKNIRNQAFYDFEGFHPNIQSCRDRTATRNYILKDGPEGDSLFEQGTFDDGKRGGGSRAAWKAALEATTYEETMKAVAEASPRDYILSNDRVQSFAEQKNTTLTAYVPNPDDVFSVPEHITNWVMNEYSRTDRPKTLLIVGGSRLGKTRWARSLSSHVYWNGMMDLRTFNKDAHYIIFDDFEFAFMPSKKSWWGAQKEFTITDKYRGKKTIQWGKPLIYLCNPDADPYRTPLWNDWFDENTIRVVINDPLF